MADSTKGESRLMNFLKSFETDQNDSDMEIVTNAPSQKRGRTQSGRLKNAKADNAKLVDIIKELSDEIIALKKRVIQLEERNETKDRDIESVKDNIKELKQNPPKLSFSQVITDSKSQHCQEEHMVAIKITSDELEERVRRKNCLLLSGCDESKDIEEEKRQVHAKSLADEVFRTIGVNIKFSTYRFKKTNNEHPSFIKVTLENEYDKAIIFRNQKKLRASKFSNVYINPDLTVFQRKARKTLIIERNKRNDEQNEDQTADKNKIWIVRNERLALVDRRAKQGEP